MILIAVIEYNADSYGSKGPDVAHNVFCQQSDSAVMKAWLKHQAFGEVTPACSDLRRGRLPLRVVQRQ